MRLKALFQKVRDVDRRFGLFKPDDKILLAVSGGPDSMALLWLLSKLSRTDRWALAVAHVHYGLDKAYADRALRLVRKTCDRLHLPLYVKKVVFSRSAEGRVPSLEHKAREIRYAFFSEICRRHGYKKIATAHTLDDQAETVLLRLVRGSGLRGLSAIHPRRSFRDAELVRPLLYISKDEILRFLRSEKISYAKDPSNSSDRHLRNRIRRRLLPEMEKTMNPNMKRILVQWQEHCSQAHDWIAAEAQRALKKISTRSSKGRLRLSLKRLALYHPALRAEILDQAMTSLRASPYPGTASSRVDLERLLFGKAGGGIWRLPGGLKIEKDKRLAQAVISRTPTR